MNHKIISWFFSILLFQANFVVAKESGGMPQLNPEYYSSQIFWLIFFFSILFLLSHFTLQIAFLMSFILKPISNNLSTLSSVLLACFLFFGVLSSMSPSCAILSVSFVLLSSLFPLLSCHSVSLPSFWWSIFKCSSWRWKRLRMARYVDGL